MTLGNSVRYGNTTIDYEVRRSARRKKTVQITVDGGGVQVAAPMTTPDSELRTIVRKRAPWILSHASQSTLEAAPKRFVSGETLPYLGHNVRILVETSNVGLPKRPFRPLALQDCRAKGPTRRGALPIHSQGRYPMVSGPRRRAVGGHRGTMVASVGPRRDVTGAHPRPAPAMGKLRTRRDAALQLASRHAEVGPH